MFLALVKVGKEDFCLALAMKLQKWQSSFKILTH